MMTAIMILHKYYAINSLSLQLNLDLKSQSTMCVREKEVSLCVWLLEVLGHRVPFSL